MRRYETIVILMPEVGDDEQASMEKRWDGIIAQFKGELIKIDDWGQKKLAYDIKKESRGHYLLLDYCAAGVDLIKELERVLRLEDNVLKYMTVKISETVDIEAIREQQRSEKEAMEKEAMEKESPPEKIEAEAATEQEPIQEKGEIE